MKLFLFGGAEVDMPSRSVSILKNLIKDTFIKLQRSSILHIPFARLHEIAEDKGEWKEGWLRKLMDNTGMEILNARYQSDISKANDSIIFINGGPERKKLVDSINKNSRLLEIIVNSKHIVAESSGSMALCEYLRTSSADNEIIKGLGILKDVVIVNHTTRKEIIKDLSMKI